MSCFQRLREVTRSVRDVPAGTTRAGVAELSKTVQEGAAGAFATHKRRELGA
ncbi:hypothetical protein ACFWY5_12155 [Nonomuraea sp. NPDC059007]|uniref:hypothetical protein n=1 Tax=Nonomuraea sp. NPDC059007 TaxID=3346692 RepID=UPI0036C98B44